MNRVDLDAYRLGCEKVKSIAARMRELQRKQVMDQKHMNA